MNNSLVYILLPVHNRKAITLEFVACLKRQTHSLYQLILIDDGSTDGTTEAVLSQIPETWVIKGDGNLWWAGALQAGLDLLREKSANPDSIILIINDDTLIPSDFLETGVKLVSTHSKTLFCAQAISSDTGKTIDRGVHIDWFRYRFLPAESPDQVNCLSTRGIFFKYSDLKIIGEFRPEILPHYYSDYEFTVRAERRGYSLRAPSELTLKMHEGTTGTHQLDQYGIRDYFKKAFQTRAAINPWTAVKFITVAAPLRFRLICYFHLFIYFLKCVVKALRNDLRRAT